MTDSDEEFGPDVDDVVVVVVAVLDDVGGRLLVFSKSEERDETPLMCEELFAWIGRDCVVLCWWCWSLDWLLMRLVTGAGGGIEV